MYIIYHKFAGYLERVEKVKTEGEMVTPKFRVHNKYILKANVVEDWPEELGVIIEVEDQNKYPGMYIVQVIETPILMEDIDDGIREVHEDNLILQ